MRYALCIHSFCRFRQVFNIKCSQKVNYLNALSYFYMKVHLIKEKTIEDFVSGHASGKSSFEDWMFKIKNANWNEPNDLKKTFNSVDLLGRGSNRAVFNVGGNNYRLIGKYGFGGRQVHLFICWIGTHQEYDELCKLNLQYSVNRY